VDIVPLWGEVHAPEFRQRIIEWCARAARTGRSKQFEPFGQTLRKWLAKAPGPMPPHPVLGHTLACKLWTAVASPPRPPCGRCRRFEDGLVEGLPETRLAQKVNVGRMAEMGYDPADFNRQQREGSEAMAPPRASGAGSRQARRPSS